MAELSPLTQKLVQKYQTWQRSLQPKEGVATLHVDEVASAVAAFYEKIRGVVDWREEHLMRRAAIERVLKRRLLLLKDGEGVASPLVLELIRGGHFPNDKIAESKIEEIKKIIDKYIYILEAAPSEGQTVQFTDWLLGVAACEIEETLSPFLREKALIEYMEEMMRERIKVKKIEISEIEKNNQIYIAVQKALLKLDPHLIAYNLLKRRYPGWPDLTKNDSQLAQITKNICLISESIEKDFKHPLSERFYKICERYDTPYLILGDVISEDPLTTGEKIKEPAFLESKTTEAYQKRLGKLKGRMKRAAIYATLSIFVTKMLLAFALEAPLERFFTGQYDSSGLMLNILIPSFLMVFMVLTIRPPRKENLQLVILEVMKIAYQKERKDIYLITPSPKRGKIMQASLTILYLLTFLASFGAISWGLSQLNFWVLSIAIFLIFISLISFAGMKIRERARELEVSEKKEGFLMMLIDLFSVPIFRMGKWLSSQWVRFNIVVVLINFLIDMPFQRFVEFLEQWRAFLREKKEEIH